VAIKEGEDGELDVEHLLSVFGQGRSMLPDVESEFRTKPLPVNILTLAMGGDRLGAFCHLFNHDSMGPRCCVGTLEERQRAMQTISGTQAVVVCATALMTAFLSETWSLLDLQTKVLVSPGTLDLLRANSGRVGAILGPTNALRGGPRWSRTAFEFASKLGDFLDVLDSRATVVGAEPLARLPPARRELLTKYFGDDCAESIAIAADAGCPLWTDDFAAGVFAEGEFRVARVWTQTIASHFVRQRFEPALSNTLTASLLGWQYAFTFSDRSAWRAAGTLAAWNAGVAPSRCSGLAVRIGDGRTGFGEWIRSDHAY
jgi:hypothetical protein